MGEMADLEAGEQILTLSPDSESNYVAVDAAYHALAEGGILIFETPNPENLIIGACNFYFDPTHLHPIVPDVAQFIATQRGFSSAQILRLHPFPEDYQMSGDSHVENALNRFFFSHGSKSHIRGV